MLPLRLLCSPVKAKFFVAPMNLIDFLSLLPFYISLVFIALEDFSDIGKAGKIIRLIKVIRDEDSTLIVEEENLLFMKELRSGENTTLKVQKEY